MAENKVAGGRTFSTHPVRLQHNGVRVAVQGISNVAAATLSQLGGDGLGQVGDGETHEDAGQVDMETEESAAAKSAKSAVNVLHVQVEFPIIYNFPVDKYREKESIGSGSFGDVFRYVIREHDDYLQGYPREVAVKVYRKQK